MHLAVDEAAERFRAFGQARPQQRLHFVDDAGGELRVNAARDALGQQRRLAAARATGVITTSGGNGDTVSTKCAVSGLPV